MTILFFLSFLITYSFFSVIIWSLRNGISPMPTGRKAKKAILQLIQENFKPDVEGNILELGSGFLTLALPIAKQYPDKKVIAYETSEVPYALSKLRAYYSKRANLRVLKQDFFLEDFNEACLIVCYLYPGAMEKLGTKFEKELKSGTMIVSNTFAIPEWKPVRTVVLDDIYRTHVYLYIYQAP